jgi:hypothetical protein
MSNHFELVQCGNLAELRIARNKIYNAHSVIRILIAQYCESRRKTVGQSVTENTAHRAINDIFRPSSKHVQHETKKLAVIYYLNGSLNPGSRCQGKRRVNIALRSDISNHV